MDVGGGKSSSRDLGYIEKENLTLTCVNPPLVERCSRCRLDE